MQPDDIYSQHPNGHRFKPLPPSCAPGCIFGIIFLGIPISGGLLYALPFGLPQYVPTLLMISFFLVFVIGYAIWNSASGAVAIVELVRLTVKTTFRWVTGTFRRGKARDKRILSSEVNQASQRLKERAARGGKSFTRVGWVVGIIAAIISLLLPGATRPGVSFVVILLAHIAWGYLLTDLARQGSLNFLSSDGTDAWDTGSWDTDGWGMDDWDMD